MGISNSNMAFGYRLTPDLASQIQTSGPESRYPVAFRLPRSGRLPRAGRRHVPEHN